MAVTAGFLWDSLSENMGDQAVGLALLRLAARQGVRRLRPVVVGEESVPGRHRLLVIGGGELLHPPGHPFYDLFRVPGEHILNTPGTAGPQDASHLRSYRLAAVRSEWDRENLRGAPEGLGVVPCLSVLFPEVAEEGGGAMPLAAGALGLHVTAAVRSPPGGWRRALAPLDSARTGLLSLTPYNQDLRVGAAVAAAAGLPPPSGPLGPDAAFGLIRRLGGLVATSLHATLFAYAAGVPFLSLAYAPKVRCFLAERGLEERILEGIDELPGKLALLDPGSCGWDAALAADRRKAREFLDALLGELDRALSVGRRSRGAERSFRGDPLAAHRMMMEGHREHGLKVAEGIAAAEAQETGRQYAERLEGELAAKSRREEELEGYVRSLEAELRRREGDLSARSSSSARLEEELTRWGEEYRRLEGYARRLEEELARWGEEHRRLEGYTRGLEGELSRQREERRRVEGWARGLEERVAHLGHSPDRQGLAGRRVHAVIVHHRGVDLLGRCLESLLAGTGVQVQAIVVSNACSEPLPGIATESPRVHVVHSSESLSFSCANNLGADWGRRHLGVPDYYFFVNNDTAVETSTVATLVTAMEEHPECGIAGPRLMIWGTEDHLNSLGLQITGDGNAWDEGIGIRLRDYGPLPRRREVLAVTGSALMIRATALQRLGCWAELYEYYYEDIDLCLRARSRGWEVLHVPEAVMWHAVSATVEGMADFKVLRTWRNRWLLMVVHWPWWLLLAILPRLAAAEVVIFVRRLVKGSRRDARLQAAAWRGALARLRRALVLRRRSGGERSWWRSLQPPGSVPPISLPAPEARGALPPPSGSGDVTAGETGG